MTIRTYYFTFHHQHALLYQSSREKNKNLFLLSSSSKLEKQNHLVVRSFRRVLLKTSLLYTSCPSCRREQNAGRYEQDAICCCCNAVITLHDRRLYIAHQDCTQQVLVSLLCLVRLVHIIQHLWGLP
jgi:hypothetical protein